MIIYNCLIEGRLKSIEIEEGKIKSVGENVSRGDIDAAGRRVIPGLIDIHTHGCNGIDTLDADFEPMCRFYAEHGTTSFLATAMTASYEKLLDVTGSKTDFEGANILGFHLEGPYISPQFKGAQNAEFIQAPNIAGFGGLKNVKLVTLAPEVEGSIDFIRAVAPEVVVSIGHTSCDYETALRAIEAGAKSLTHTYNAMPPLHHRRPGPIGAAFEKHIYAEIICDGFHISKPVVLATYAMFGRERMILVSDSIRSAGCPDGEYDSGGLQVFVKNGAAHLADGTIAGSNSMLWGCVKTAVSFGIGFDDAVAMATSTPAALLGVNKGNIKPGYDADLLIISDNMEIDSVIVGGEIFK